MNHLELLLNKNDLSSVKKLAEQLRAGFDKQIMFRSEYLMRVSVLDDMRRPTPDSKYWQASLERDVMYQNLVALSFDYREKKADIAIKEERLKEASEVIKEKIKIQIERLQSQLVRMKKEASERVREILMWTKIMAELEPQLEFGTDSAENHQVKSYPLRFARQVELIKDIGPSDMNGAMNILSQYKTAFENEETKQLLERETRLSVDDFK